MIELVERLRYEADISDRPGQMDRLNAIADELAAALAAAEAAGYRMVREARECRHCGWLCAPNSEQSKSWYPLTAAAPQPEEAP